MPVRRDYAVRPRAGAGPMSPSTARARAAIATTPEIVARWRTEYNELLVRELGLDPDTVVRLSVDEVRTYLQNISSRRVDAVRRRLSSAELAESNDALLARMAEAASRSLPGAPVDGTLSDPNVEPVARTWDTATSDPVTDILAARDAIQARGLLLPVELAAMPRRSRTTAAPVVAVDELTGSAAPVPSGAPAPTYALTTVNLDHLVIDDAETLNPTPEMVESVRLVGVFQPIAVRQIRAGTPVYEIVAGRRRVRAARQTGRTTIPALVFAPGTSAETIARVINDENARRSANVLSDLGAILRLGGDTRPATEIAAILGLTPREVNERRRLQRLHHGLREALQAGEITPWFALRACALADGMQQALVNLLHSRRQTDGAAARLTRGDLPRTRAAVDATDGDGDGDGDAEPNVIAYVDRHGGQLTDAQIQTLILRWPQGVRLATQSLIEFNRGAVYANDQLMELSRVLDRALAARSLLGSRRHPDRDRPQGEPDARTNEQQHVLAAQEALQESIRRMELSPDARRRLLRRVETFAQAAMSAVPEETEVTTTAANANDELPPVVIGSLADVPEGWAGVVALLDAAEQAIPLEQARSDEMAQLLAGVRQRVAAAAV